MRKPLVLAVTALMTFAPAASAGAASATVRVSAFSGQVCSLLTSSQVAAVHVMPLKCTAQKPIKGSGGTFYYGNWGGTALAPHLAVSIAAYTDATALQQAKTNLGRFANAKKVTGIGSVAYESTGGTSSTLNFVVGKYVCEVGLQTKRPLKTAAAFDAVGEAIAAKL